MKNTKIVFNDNWEGQIKQVALKNMVENGLDITCPRCGKDTHISFSGDTCKHCGLTIKFGDDPKV